ncbi:uncharacterized protein BT62DRAFT_654971 [Guyanagaster necrorhizus]|uniref:RRM domain-containing protein n=1 Tax=Guyanagaster necrorhizus TaxID=856835 RepID=A0A9P7VYV7_9AGAR|nr:uncharacterized protein BT62DRAFT_654971 [Guyanagaster necrorhizus MCA 3950]KAG7448965.1 hypothetical protein BT62DRAFT_654971 [Guyanagaster necrorhizus MCA 3950]
MEILALGAAYDPPGRLLREKLYCALFCYAYSASFINTTMSSRGRSTSPKPLQGRGRDASMSPPISPNANAKVVIVTNLTRNVVESHLQTIFGFYGHIIKIDLPLFGKSGQNKGKAALEYSDPVSAHKAASHMNGGQLDGAILKVELSNLPVRSRSRSPKARRGARSFSRSYSRSRSRSRSPPGRYRRRGGWDGYRGGRGGRRGGGFYRRGRSRTHSRSRSPPRRSGDRLGPRRRSPSYQRGGYGRRRSRSRSYSVRSSRSRSRSYSRSRSRSSYSSYSKYSRSRSRSRSVSRGRRSHSRDDIRDSRSRSPMRD